MAHIESHSHSQFLLNITLSRITTAKTVVQFFSTPFGGPRPPGPLWLGLCTRFLGQSPSRQTFFWTLSGRMWALDEGKSLLFFLSYAQKVGVRYPPLQKVGGCVPPKVMPMLLSSCSWAVKGSDQTNLVRHYRQRQSSVSPCLDYVTTQSSAYNRPHDGRRDSASTDANYRIWPWPP